MHADRAVGQKGVVAGRARSGSPGLVLGVEPLAGRVGLRGPTVSMRLADRASRRTRPRPPVPRRASPWPRRPASAGPSPRPWSAGSSAARPRWRRSGLAVALGAAAARCWPGSRHRRRPRPPCRAGSRCLRTISKIVGCRGRPRPIQVVPFPVARHDRADCSWGEPPDLDPHVRPERPPRDHFLPQPRDVAMLGIVDRLAGSRAAAEDDEDQLALVRRRQRRRACSAGAALPPLPSWPLRRRRPRAGKSRRLTVSRSSRPAELTVACPRERSRGTEWLRSPLAVGNGAPTAPCRRSGLVALARRRFAAGSGFGACGANILSHAALSTPDEQLAAFLLRLGPAWPA